MILGFGVVIHLGKSIQTFRLHDVFKLRNQVAIAYDDRHNTLVHEAVAPTSYCSSSQHAAGSLSMNLLCMQTNMLCT
jgi:hypothetical protein